jgi:hypothetical protein
MEEARAKVSPTHSERDTTESSSQQNEDIVLYTCTPHCHYFKGTPFFLSFFYHMQLPAYM